MGYETRIRGSRSARDAIARISGSGVLLAPDGENLVHWADLKLLVGPTKIHLKQELQAT